MGTQQSGVLALKIADLVKDKAILQQARVFATHLLQSDPGLILPEHESTRQHLGRLMQDKNLWNFIS
jgi:ATP-dependent DNA helicase RecG